MSNPYQQPHQPPKRLERSRSNKVVGGVCGGVAKYLNMDPTLVRVLTVVLSLFTGVPIIVYIVALFALPEESGQPPYSVNPPQYDQQQYDPQPYGQPQYGQPQYDQSGYGQSSPGQQAGAWTPSGEPQAAPVQPAWGATPSAPASATDPLWGANGAPWDQAGTTEPAPQDPAPSEPRVDHDEAEAPTFDPDPLPSAPPTPSVPADEAPGTDSGSEQTSDGTSRH